MVYFILVIVMGNFKKNLGLYVVIFFIVLLGVFLVYKFAFDNKNDESHLVNISVNDLGKKIDNQETFILVLSQTGCSHCEQYLPELDRTLSKYDDLYAYVLNITGLDTENKSNLNHFVNFSGTPTTVFYIEGKETTTLNRFNGYASSSKIIERLKSLGYID